MSSEKTIEASSPSNSRAAVLDGLRGFALLGIVIINSMTIFAVPGAIPDFSFPLPAVDRLLQDAVLLLVESKFFTLFSLLFGIGFAIQLNSAERQNAAFLPRISRRFAALFVFGCLHIAFFWDGDILLIYAVTGLLLVAMRRISDRAIRRWVVSLLAVPGALVLAIFIFSIVGRFDSNLNTLLAGTDREIAQSFSNLVASQPAIFASFMDAIPLRISSYSEVLPLLMSRIPTVLAMFLIGLYVGRKKIYLDLESWVPVLRKWRSVGLGFGFGLASAVLISTKTLPATSALVALIEDQYIVGPLAAIGLACGFALLYLRAAKSKTFEAFARVGRMALTNYLMQSVVLTFLAYGWGLGLATKVSGFGVLAIAFFLFLAQSVASSLWLRVFAFGPMEWIWRSLTYLRLFPIRKVEQQKEEKA